MIIKTEQIIDLNEAQSNIPFNFMLHAFRDAMVFIAIPNARINLKMCVVCI